MHPDAPGPGTVSPLVVPGIVALPAEIDIGNAVRVGDELGAALGSGAAIVIADMTLTEFCDSSGIRQLMMAHDRAVAGSAELRLVVRSAALIRVLQVMGVDRLLDIYPSLQAALANGMPARTAETAGTSRLTSGWLGWLRVPSRFAGVGTRSAPPEQINPTLGQLIGVTTEPQADSRQGELDGGRQQNGLPPLVGRRRHHVEPGIHYQQCRCC